VLPQNKIAGLSIAWGRGKWKSLGDRMGYVFPEHDAYQIRVTQQYMASEGFVEDDLYDCIEQIEAKYGGPDDHRVPFGLFKNSGHTPLGLVVTSRTNPSITCVFTPTSTEDNDYDGYFEWYYSRESAGVDNMQQFLGTFDRATGGRHTNINASPVTLPGYQEACERAEGVLAEAEKQWFIRQIWNYQKTNSKGFKYRIEQELLPMWKKVLKAERDTKCENIALKSPMMREKLQRVIWEFFPEDLRYMHDNKRYLILVGLTAEVLNKSDRDECAVEDLSDEEMVKVATSLNIL